MKTKGIRMRWLYETCFEIALPNGTVILTDPDLTVHGLEVTAGDIQRVDYILCTHTHFDHTSDIGFLMEKFDCKLLVGQLSAQDLCRFFNLPYSRVYMVGPDEVFEFPDVTIRCFRGKHTAPPPDPVRGRPASALNTTKKNFDIEGYGFADQFGWIEFFDYIIVSPNNQTIMMAGGIPAYRKAEEMAHLHRPDILIRQPGGFEGVEDYAAFLDRIGAQVAFPSHHEHLDGRMKMPVEQYMSRVAETLELWGSMTTFVNPQQHRWYEIASCVDLL